MDAISFPSQVTLQHNVSQTFRMNVSDTYVTGSVKVISASRGPVPVKAPFSDRSNPSSEMFLVDTLSAIVNERSQG